MCQRIGFHGLMANGGLAGYTVVPERMLRKLPDTVIMELGAMVEPMAVELMADGHYRADGWVSHIESEQLHEEGFAALHAGKKMKVLVEV